MAADGVRVQTCVTSPPYFGLRDYGTGSWTGGTEDCDHVSGPARKDTGNKTPGGRGGSIDSGTLQFRDVCGNCGAQRVDQQIGLESTPDEYVQKLVEVFRAVRNVLADDGTLWLNLGDSYASGASGVSQSGVGERSGLRGNGHRGGGAKLKSLSRPGHPSYDGLKPKDLMGMPWRVAFALQADCWYLRSDIIWHKPNPMPESVTDRPTKSHEYLFLLAKSERYYYDAQAIREQVMSGAAHSRGARLTGGAYAPPGQSAHGNARGVNPKARNAEFGCKQNESFSAAIADIVDERNRRSVWTVASEPFEGAHFACFPRKLIEPCILAGCPAGGTVLDCFMGSGTTGQVATDLGRDFIGCELNSKYVELHEMRRTTIGMPL